MKMTIQEAINICEIAIAEVEWNYPLEYAIAFETLIEAVKNGGGQSEEVDR